ncbi:penicillin-binding protein 1C [Marivirga sp. S37H4]|uniref:peptidoglycan glycosyltransferase n=1 Tax=Marivirga aurantiaca TaxID=2802615 RepID=A0A934WWV7_9BACT|nr:penicillin-binding protein 1C [Marivirga aurantiaca]MBK6264397.1 penicillin-binding protein 1C [Marivirga aurantiaca]
MHKKITKWIIAGSILLGILLFLFWPLQKPIFDKPFATVLLDKDKQLLGAVLAKDEIWRFPPQKDIPERFATALITYEDEYFYSHPGINPVAIVKAMRENIRQGRIVRGGSTLSMQLARLADGNRDRTWRQKVKEILMAFRFEAQLSKKEILALYITHAPFGSNIEGLTAASWRYFGRAPEALSWGEAATLAVLPNQPAMIYPGRNTDYLKKKRDFLLQKLKNAGYLDETGLKLAKSEEIPQSQQPFPKIAQHLLFDFHAKQPGKLLQTSLDWYKQERISEIANQYSRTLEANQIHNAAVLVLDWRKEEVVAYVGNVSTGEEHHQNVDIVRSLRSPGSLLKPLLYAHAIDKGMISPWQLLPDIPIFYEGFSPKNFDHNYYGAVKADRALARSLNIPFVDLLRDYGYYPFHQDLKTMGFKSLNKPASHYGLSLILGGAEISLWEAGGLYVKLARSLYPEWKSKKEINVLKNFAANKENKSEQQKHPLSAGSAWLTLKAMKEVARPGEEAGWEQFGSSQNIAWKTGTSFGFRDAWALGINQQYVVAVWTGNADGEGRPGLIGSRTAAPLMFQLFDLLKGGEKDFKMPLKGMKVQDFCQETGYLATVDCPHPIKNYVNIGAQLLEACPYHRQIFTDQEGKRVNSDCYPVSKMKKQLVMMLPPAQARFYKKYNTAYTEPPEWNNNCLKSKNASMEMIYPRQSTKIIIPKEISGDKGRAIFEVAHQSSQAIVYWYLDDLYLGSTEGTHQMEIDTDQEGQHKLYLADSEGEYLSFTFEVANNKSS